MMRDAGGRGDRAPTALGPGLLAAIAVAAMARLAGMATPGLVGEAVLAILFGLMLAQVIRGTAVQPGLAFAVRRVLRLGIVLLGAELSLSAIVALGLDVLLIAVLLIVGILVLAFLGGRLLGVEPRLALLLGVGTAICGNTAIIATAPVIGAREREVGFAVGTITLIGLLAVLTYPAIGHALDLHDRAYGVWSGLAVNDTSQVVAASFAYSDAAGGIAVAVKLARNAMMAPVLLGIGLWWISHRSHDGATTSGAVRPRYREAVPFFVLGFVALAALNSLGLLEGQVAGVSVNELAAGTARALILIALAALGLSTRISALREVGAKPLIFGLLLAVMLAAASLTYIQLTRG